MKDPIVFPNEFLEELTKLFQANIVMYAYHAWNLHKCNVQFKKQILNFDNLKKKKKMMTRTRLKNNDLGGLFKSVFICFSLRFLN